MNTQVENRRIVVLAALQALTMTASVLFMTIGGIVGHVLSTDKSLATLPMAITVIGTALATIPASFAIRRYGWRSGFMIGIFFGLAAGGISAVAIHRHDFSLFSLGYFLMGVYLAFGNYYRFAAAEAVKESLRSRAISLVLAGGIVAAIAGPQLVKWTADWFAPDRFLGAYLAVMALALVAGGSVMALRLSHSGRDNATDAVRPLLTIVRQPNFVIAAAGSAIGYGVMILAMSAAPLAMVGHQHALNDAAFAIQAHVLGMFVPSFFTGTLISRFGVLRIMAAGIMLFAVHVIIAVSGVTVPHFVSALVFLGVGWNFLYVGGTTLLAESHTAAERAKVQGLNDFIVFGVVAGASLSSGWLLHHFGWEVVNYLALPFLALMAALLAWRPRGRENATATSA